MILTAEDNAGNAEVARRFLIFDDTNVVTTSSDSDKPLRVTSAIEDTAYTWLTKLQDALNIGEKASIQVWGVW